jgi:membrane peptidoglycan carboxypeptidase
MRLSLFLLAFLPLTVAAFPGEEWDRNRAAYMETLDRLLSDIRSATNHAPHSVSVIYDRNGELLAEIPDPSLPLYASLDSIPLHLMEAVVQSEDKNFFHHPGVDIKGITRAALRNLRRGKVSEGGSTLTQQLVKMLFTTGERTFARKSFDIRAAVDIEEYYSKDDILLIYLNTVYLGHGTRGVEQASRFYFGKPVGTITPAEAALLAGLLTRPNAISPYKNPGLARTKQEIVLRKMKETGYTFDVETLLTEFWDRYGPRYATAFSSLRPLEKNLDPFWSDLLEEESLRLIPADTNSAETNRPIFTSVGTVDLPLQIPLREAATSFLKEKGSITNGLETAFVLMDNRTGEVLAMAGGSSYGLDNQLNRAVRMRRQTGSLIKPFLYAAAFEAGLMDPSTVLTDRPLSLRDKNRIWRPENYDRTCLGPLTVTEALRRSRNIPAVRTVLSLGTEKFCGFLDRVWGRDIASAFKDSPSIALGTIELSPLEVCQGFAVLASEGAPVPRPVSPFLRNVMDEQGESVYDSVAERIFWSVTSPQTNLIAPDAARKVTEILRTVTEEGGTAHEAALETGFTNSGRVACKTGTTANFRDAWAVVYDRDRTLVVWIGYDRKQDALPGSGGRLTAPLAFKLWMKMDAIKQSE